MGGGITTCPLDVSNNTSPVNRWNPIFNDIWGGGCDFFGNWLPNAENKCIHFRQQWWAARNEFRLDWRTKRECNYQHKLKQGYDSNVKLRPLSLEDLVLRKVLGTTKNPAWEKLGHNWEGPYRITLVARIGVYYLEDLDEKTVLHSWNVSNLRRYYY